MSDPVLVSVSNGVATVTLNRPEARNALDVALKDALREALRAVEADANCRATLLAGAGEKAFCVGQDLREHVGNLKTADPLATVFQHYNPIARLLHDSDKPVVAAVRGAAAGAGASLAFLADFRVGGPSTSFTLAFTGIGLAADTGASHLLPRLVGSARAAELLMLNSRVSAETAASYGLLTEVAETDDEVLPRARQLAEQLAAGPTLAFAQVKKLLRRDDGFAEALEAEAKAQDVCGASVDHRNAVDAFVSKRKPEFEGR